MGVANRKSVAWFTAKTLEEAGAQVVFSVRSQERLDSLKKLLGDRETYVCDVEFPDQIETLAEQVAERHDVIHGIVHSIAFADYSDGFRPFHETQRSQFLQATGISAFSIVEIARAFKPLLASDASFVSMGISSQVTAENYGYMSPIKVALESCTRFLAKSFSADSEVRFNTVNAGPLKTSASAGIPGYLESYLFAEKMTLRKRALQTQEVADAAVYLLSPRSSGINAQGITVNAGMDWNYFDKELIDLAMRPES
ncbi:MAG: SDR family oxidoreductase [Opitutales bacterium]|nr:SDR family oxidoreductase [Opitutales bacterium]